jgi:FkbM family methyltransferase
MEMSLPQRPKDLTREHIEWAYRLFLDREPESEATVAGKLATWSTTQELRVDFMTAAEFKAKNKDLAVTNESTVVIKEIGPGLRLFVDLSDQVIGMGIIRGSYEAAELDFIRRHLKRGQIALDLGANIGFFAIQMAALVGRGGRVSAFEPVPRHADLLARSVAENSFAERVELVRAAVSEAPGKGNLFAGSDSLNHGGSYLHRPGATPEVSGNLIGVPIIQLDSFPLRRPVSFIKIDVEGAEPLALRGARRLLREDRPTILAELNPPQLARVAAATPAGLLAEMAALGYACNTLDGRAAAEAPELGDGGVHSIVFVPSEAAAPGRHGGGLSQRRRRWLRR